MKDNIIGRFAVSKAGHDKGCVYLIKASDDKYVYLSDGRFHPWNKPKKKNIKHVQMMSETAVEPLYSRLYKEDKVFDHEIKYAIKTAIRKEEEHGKE